MEEVQNEYQRQHANSATSQAKKRKEYAERAERLKEQVLSLHRFNLFLLLVFFLFIIC
jgi:hypothetical protein